MKWIEKNLYLVYEWILTFSNKKSLLSSKRIERFLVFNCMLIITCIFLIKAIWTCTLSSTDLMIVVGTWLGYAGFNTIQGRKDDKPTDTNNEQNG